MLRFTDIIGLNGFIRRYWFRNDAAILTHDSDNIGIVEVNTFMLILIHCADARQ